MQTASFPQPRRHVAPDEAPVCSCCAVGTPVAVLRIHGVDAAICDACLGDHSDLIQVPDAPTDVYGVVILSA